MSTLIETSDCQLSSSSNSVTISSAPLAAMDDVDEGFKLVVTISNERMFEEVDKCRPTESEVKNQVEKKGKVELSGDYWLTAKVKEIVRIGSFESLSQGIVRIVREIGSEDKTNGPNPVVFGRFCTWFTKYVDSFKSELLSLKDLVFLYCYDITESEVITDVTSVTVIGDVIHKKSTYVPVNGKFVKLGYGEYQITEMSRKASANMTRFENPPAVILYVLYNHEPAALDNELATRFSDYIMLEHFDDGIHWDICHFRLYKRDATVTITPRAREGMPTRSITVSSFIADYVFQAMCHLKWRMQGKGSLRLYQRGLRWVEFIIQELRAQGKAGKREFSSNVAIFHEAIRLTMAPDLDDGDGLEMGTGNRANVATGIVSWRKMNTASAHSSGLFMDEFGFQLITRAMRSQMRRLHPVLAAFYLALEAGYYGTPVPVGLSLRANKDMLKFEFIKGPNGLKTSSEVMLRWFGKGGKHYLGEMDYRSIGRETRRQFRDQKTIANAPAKPDLDLVAQVRLLQKNQEELLNKIAQLTMQTAEPLKVAEPRGRVPSIKKDSEVVVVEKPMTYDPTTFGKDTRSWTEMDDDDNDDKVEVVAVRKPQQPQKNISHTESKILIDVAKMQSDI